jgi:hypothetical protein
LQLHIDPIPGTAAGNSTENSREAETSQFSELATTDSVDMHTSDAWRDVSYDQPVKLYLRTARKNPSSTTSSLSFCNEIAAANNMTFVSVPGDGSCQYFAVIEGLKALGLTPLMNVTRTATPRARRNPDNRDRYEPFLDSTVGRFVTYARGILRKQWGDGITLKAMASILRINIEVIRFDCNGQNIYRIGNENEDYRNTIFLTLDDRHHLLAHYGVLIPQRATDKQ